ncbi:MAG: rhomboid family intramembrane serine protease [Sedimentisphaerales bacterium]|nr:rhomboid family intramembrane serine protease [Sedimentisphaerales bacterium]
MGLYDRDYTQANFRSKFDDSPQMRMALPQVTPMVKRLLIVNVAVYFLQILGADRVLVEWFSLYPVSLPAALQLWRLITYQFLHGGLGHILFNMLGLYFLGPTLERHWGGKRFLFFYLYCGAVGGLFYILLVVIGFLPALPMIGASGALLGIFAACAILFPGISVFFFPILIPIPIRVAAIGGTLIYILFVATRSANAGGHAAHLAGMAAGAMYVFSQSWRARLTLKIQSGRWQKKMEAQRNLQSELDRILQKVHDSGIHSLTPREAKTLRQATEAEQKRIRL